MIIKHVVNSGQCFNKQQLYKNNIEEQIICLYLSYLIHSSTIIFEITNYTLIYFVKVKGQATKTYSIYNLSPARLHLTYDKF